MFYNYFFLYFINKEVSGLKIKDHCKNFVRTGCSRNVNQESIADFKIGSKFVEPKVSPQATLNYLGPPTFVLIVAIQKMI